MAALWKARSCGAISDWRLSRIIPLYWFANVVVFALVNGTPTARLPTLASMFFAPLYSNAPNPLLAVGWTLNVELAFYMIFACFVGFRAITAVVMVSATICILYWSQWFPIASAEQYWNSPKMLEFVLGAGLGLAFMYGLKLNATIAALLTAAGIGALAYVLAYLPWENIPLSVGLPLAVILYGSVCLPQISTANILGRIFVLLGDASYGLYLFHWIVVCFVHGVPWTLLVAMSVAISVIVRISIELPLMKWLRSRLRKRSPGVPAEMVA